MSVEGNLPSGKQRNGQQKQAPRIIPLEKEKRSKHHGVVPVVDAAGATALVFQKPALERAEKQDADHVADRVSAGKQDHNPVI